MARSSGLFRAGGHRWVPLPRTHLAGAESTRPGGPRKRRGQLGKRRLPEVGPARCLAAVALPRRSPRPECYGMAAKLGNAGSWKVGDGLRAESGPEVLCLGPLLGRFAREGERECR